MPGAATTLTTEISSTTLGETPTSPTTSTTTTTEPPTPIGFAVEPLPEPPAPAAGMADDFAGTGLLVVATGGADLRATPDDAPYARLREGMPLPAEGAEDGHIKVFTMCDEEAWVDADQVRAVPAARPAIPGHGFDFGAAVIAVDPGHGGANIGAVSPDGDLLEKDVNLDIARRLRDLLEAPKDVDWETGKLYVGDAIPAAGRVVMTRVGAGAAGDYEAGLLYRARLANAAGAHVFVSIHNNAGWEAPLDQPGSDVYYQSQLAESRRLAAILIEEFQRSFRPFEADWVGALEVGAKSRLSPREGNPQYYGVLRRTTMPAVIAEGAYLASRSEAELLATPEFRQAYADAVYRALVRFLTSDDTGGTSFDPEVWTGQAGSGAPRPDCVVPEQP